MIREYNLTQLFLYGNVASFENQYKATSNFSCFLPGSLWNAF